MAKRVHSSNTYLTKFPTKRTTPIQYQHTSIAYPFLLPW